MTVIESIWNAIATLYNVDGGITCAGIVIALLIIAVAIVKGR